jgi:hypothetical protein
MSAIREILNHKVRKVSRVRLKLSRVLVTVAAVPLALTVATGIASTSAASAQPSFAAQARTVSAVSGQMYAHSVTNARSGIETASPETCPVGAFCTFASPNFTGHRSEYFECNTWFSNNDNGSWKNDQTAGIRATLRIYNTFTHTFGYYTTCAAYCNDAHWTAGVDIIAVDPC